MSPLSKISRSMTPKTLFVRALLILVLPVILIQFVAMYIFYDRHWASVERQLSGSLTGEVGWLIERWEDEPDAQARQLLADQASYNYGLQITDLPEKIEPPTLEESQELEFPLFEKGLRSRAKRRFWLQNSADESKFHIMVPSSQGTIQITSPRKRLATSTTFIFTAWMMGSALVLIWVAILFLRNQIRPIIQLSSAAEKFGRGQEVENFKPSGASEVRQAARAFIDMRGRIRRQVESRTAMLAGISHDLRTPLTRMRLELEMLPQTIGLADLRQDMDDMERMVNSYLNFASGEGSEAALTMPISELIEQAVEPYLRKNGAQLHVGEMPNQAIMVKPHAMVRVLRNLIDNALRYGDYCWINVKLNRKNCKIMIDDNGIGIDAADREEVFGAFKRLEESRNLETGGAGLGLTIVRDIVQSHGGVVELEHSPYETGLRVVISLPL